MKVKDTKPDFLFLLNQIKTDSENQQKILNQIRLQLFIKLHNNAFYQDEDTQEGNATVLTNLSVDDINNFFSRLEKENIDFNPNNHQKISSFFWNYFKQATYYKKIDLQRKKWRYVSYDGKVIKGKNISYIDILPDRQPTPEEKLINQETQDLINALLKDQELTKIHIKGNEKCNLTAILNRKLQQKTFQEIASEFNVKIGTLTSFWHRSKLRLQQKLR